MITIGGHLVALDDPMVIAGLGAAGVVLLLLVLVLRAAGRSARMTEPLLYQMNQVGHRVQQLSDGQQQLAGGLHHV